MTEQDRQRQARKHMHEALKTGLSVRMATDELVKRGLVSASLGRDALHSVATSAAKGAGYTGSVGVAEKVSDAVADALLALGSTVPAPATLAAAHQRVAASATAEQAQAQVSTRDRARAVARRAMNEYPDAAHAGTVLARELYAPPGGDRGHAWSEAQVKQLLSEPEGAPVPTAAGEVVGSDGLTARERAYCQAMGHSPSAFLAAKAAKAQNATWGR